MLGFLNKILGSGVTSYPTYLEHIVLVFGIFSLWRPAISVKMNGYLGKINMFFVWIFSIDWYLNWPHWTFIYWDRALCLVLGGIFIWGKKEYFEKKIFFLDYQNKFLLSKSRKKSLGIPVVHICLGLVFSFHKIIQIRIEVSGFYYLKSHI